MVLSWVLGVSLQGFVAIVSGLGTQGVRSRCLGA